MFNILLIFLILLILLIFFLFFILKKKKNHTYGVYNTEVSGFIFSKYDNLPLKNVKVMLGNMDNKNNENIFIKKDNLEMYTDINGKFIFQNIKISNYWVYAAHKGKKVLTYIKINDDKKIIDDIILKV